VDVAQLIQTIDHLTKAAQVVVAEWSSEVESLSNSATGGSSGDRQTLPSHELYEAQRIILAATGKLTELISEPSLRILEVATQFQESRALYIAAERRIPDILAEKDNTGGTSISEVSERVKIESRKLCKLAMPPAIVIF
jgi:hypothetical protein